MSGFAITPAAAYPPVPGDDFPQFIQFQQEGANIGLTNVSTVNFTGDVGVSLSSSGTVLTVDIIPRPFEWVDVPGDYTLVLTDNRNGLRTSGGSGVQMITIPPNSDVPFEPGDSILVFVAGDAGVEFFAPSGVNLLYRNAFNPAAAGQFATLTLIADLVPDTWILCGDLELIPA